MHVILTHEQADFDAIASQLGAWLLESQAIPVLPGRINRNVRAFLTIYGLDLPFVERRDLQKKHIDQVTMVDTQSSVTLKGMDAKTRVRVIDHHPPRKDLPEDWEKTIQETGATATLFVEALREKHLTLTAIEASLLLLGIYEDTGSLTYTRTTARDLQASAYLLQHGASLQIAKEYMNLPLSLSQQELLDQLRRQARFVEIHNHDLVIATGDASHIHEELSSIAHKLRDLLDPDGLFMLVKVRGGVQMVARTTDDHIDAAGIAHHFGGGGHRRASAAMIKNGDLEEITRELEEILPGFVQPPVTVAEIMSRGPQLLSPQTPISEAAERMQRYGYEGYPVIDNGQIIGLLTRRAVDRALSHRLNIPIRDLMLAGDVSVIPNDSIEDLQQRMTDSGWGQIPVISPQDGTIVGIVTRTDLLKTLALKSTIPPHRNQSERLDHFLPHDHLKLLKTIARLASQQRSAMYIVGGFVRDLLLEQPSLDFDIVIEGNAIELSKALEGRYGGRVTVHRRFGTAKWLLDDSSRRAILGAPPGDALPLPASIDLVTARTEFYTHPTALPTVERGSIKLDLHRRDFTINTLALRLDGRHYGELHDYWGGYDDLRRGLIRVLHSLSFVDDPTRMLRAVRFEKRFGFQIEARTLELLKAALVPPNDGVALLDRVSGDRIRNEISYMLQEARSAEMMERLQELELLAGIHSDLIWDQQARKRIECYRPPPPEWKIATELRGMTLEQAMAYVLWLLPLPSTRAASIADRLKMTQSVRQVLLAACELQQSYQDLRDISASVIVAWLDPLPPLAWYAVYLASDDEEMRKNIESYILRWRHLRPHTSGRDLQARGLAPGPIYKQILTMLRAAWLDGEIASVEEEASLLNEMLGGHERRGQ